MKKPKLHFSYNYIKKVKGKKNIYNDRYASYEYLDKKGSFAESISIKKFHLEDFNSTLGFSFPYMLINFFFLFKIFFYLIIKNLISFNTYLKKLFPKSENHLKQNKKLNKSCVIFGNGPSIKNLNLKKYRNIDSFFCNDAYLHKDFAKCNPNYLVFLDGFMFNPTANGLPLSKNNKLDPYRAKKVLQYKRLVNKKVPEKTNVILPYNISKESQERNKLFKNIKYVDLLNFELSDYIPSSSGLSTGLPFSINVLPWMILLAISMGYKKIYLLGSEQDIYLGGLNSFRSLKYDVTGAGVRKKTSKQLFVGCSNYISIISTKKILAAHLNLVKFSKKKGAKIINSTYRGILDMYPYRDKKFIK